VGDFLNPNSIGFAGKGFLGKFPPATSSSGPVWTARNSNIPNDGIISGIAYNGSNLWVASAGNGNAGYISTSPDGITWTLQTTVFSQGGTKQANLFQVIWDGARFVLLGQLATPSLDDIVATSVDGITWNVTILQASGLNVNVATYVAFSGSLYVATSFDASNATWGNSWSSVDAITWNNHNNFSNLGFQNVIFDGSDFVAGVQGSPALIAYSSDGVNWNTNPLNSFPQPDFPLVTFGNSLYVAVSTVSDKAEVSPSRIWAGTSSTPGLSAGGISNIGFGNGIFVATDFSNGAAHTNDGLAWTLETTGLPATSAMFVLTYGAGMFVGGGSKGFIATRSA
jgi:hypothetical protein